MKVIVLLLVLVAVSNAQKLMSDGLVSKIQKLLKQGTCQESAGGPTSADFVTQLVNADPLQTDADKCYLLCVEIHVGFMTRQGLVGIESIYDEALAISNRQIAGQIRDNCGAVDVTQTHCERGYTLYRCFFTILKTWIATL